MTQHQQDMTRRLQSLGGRHPEPAPITLPRLSLQALPPAEDSGGLVRPHPALLRRGPSGPRGLISAHNLELLRQIGARWHRLGRFSDPRVADALGEGR